MDIKESVSEEREKVRGQRKAWVTKGNVPPPRHVLPPSRKSPGDSLEAVSTGLNQLSVSDDVKINSPQRILVTHVEATNDKKSGSNEGRPLYSSPADIVVPSRDHNEAPVTMVTKSVKWGPNKYSDDVTQQQQPAPSTPHPDPVPLRVSHLSGVH